MDQIAAMGLKAIAAYKAQLDAAAAQVEVARVLARKIELFEVTIGMIPKRGDEGKAKEMRKCIPGANEDESEDDPKMKKLNEEKAAAQASGNTSKVKALAGQAANYLKEKMKTQILEQAKSFIEKTPLGEISGMATYLFGDVDTTAVINKVRPANVLNALKESGAKDIDVSFLAMRFIISAALDIVEDAVSDCEKIEPVQWFWVCMPWKVAQQNEVGEALTGHLDAIDKFNAQLQTAISIASYCVSLEQLENVLNAASMLVSAKVSDFWRRKVGINNTRVKMTELTESFLDEMCDRLLDYQQKRRFRRETVVKLQSNSEVALGRFFTSLWNDNMDKVASVFEVNLATKPYVEKYGKNCDALGLTLQEMLEIERDFFSKIKFTALVVNAGADGKDDTDDDVLVVMDNETAGDKYGVELHPNDKVISLKPFQCVRVHCQVPYFEPEIYPHDFVVLMRYNRNELKDLVHPSNELSLEEVEGARTYLNTDINSELYGKDIYRWNTPKAFKNKSGKDQMIPGFKNSNFFVTSTLKTREDEEKDQDLALEKKRGLEKADVTNFMNLLYVPVIREPGLYTVRYVLDDLELDDNQSISKAQKKMALSPRSYYYNRLLDQTSRDDNRSTANYTQDCFGEAWDEFRTLMFKILDIEHVEAKIGKDKEKPVRDFATLKRIERDRAKLLKSSKDDKFQVRPVKFEYLEEKAGAFAALPTASTAAANTSNAATNNTTAEHRMSKVIVGAAAGAEKEIEMTPNPMLKVSGKRASVKIVSCKISALYDRVAPRVEAELEAAGVAYLQSVKAHIDTNMSNRSAMLRTELQLLRIECYFLGKQLIERINGMYSKNTAQWLASWSDGEVKRNLLMSVDNNMRAVKTVNAIIDVILPSELRKPAESQLVVAPAASKKKADDTTNSKEEELQRKVESGYLADPELDRIKDAADYLPDNTLLQYLVAKEAVYQVDAQNSITRQNIRRLEMLQDKMVEIFKKETDVKVAINDAATGRSRGRASVYYSDAKAAGKLKTGEDANELILKKRVKDATPSIAAQLVSEVMAEINKYIETLLEASNDQVKRVNYRKDIKAAENCSKIVDELDLYHKKLLFLANSKPVARDDDLALGLKRFKPPLGLIVHVLDENALAWGEMVPKLQQDDQDYSYEEHGDAEGREAANAVSASEDKWRPQVDYRYPFTAKATLNFKKANYNFYDKSSDYNKDLRFAVFFNVKKVEKKTETTAAANSAPTELAPSAIGIFNKEDHTMLKKFELGKSRNSHQVIDFFELICDSHVKDSENINLIVAFEDPASPGTPMNDANHKDPLLSLNIATATNDDYEYDDDSDDDSDGNEEYNYNNNNDDDHDEDDYQYYAQVAETKAQQAEEHREDLPLSTQCYFHEHPLDRLDFVYAGEYGCDYCGEGGRGLVYHCGICNYDVHPQCACYEAFDETHIKKRQADKMKDELPLKADTHLHIHTLDRLDQVYAGAYGCDYCGVNGMGIVYHCDICGFDIHPQCIFPEKFDKMVLKEKAAEAKRDELPLQVDFEEHAHPLDRMDSVYYGEYGCDHCGEGGRGLVYHCTVCNYDAHPQCAAPSVFGIHKVVSQPDYSYEPEQEDDNDNESTAHDDVHEDGEEEGQNDEEEDHGDNQEE